jgi:hypothetical protein
MTRDEIIKLAIEAGISRSRSPDLYDIWEVSDTELERFAALVVAAERERIKKINIQRINEHIDILRARGEK